MPVALGRGMLRITTIENPDSVTLKLEGKLLAPWADEIRMACWHAGRNLPVQLDLSQVTFADQTGLALIQEFVRQGISISACSNFISELLHRVQI
jgi:ABC-type transporter Mla MlaB component